MLWIKGVGFTLSGKSYKYGKGRRKHQLPGIGWNQRYQSERTTLQTEIYRYIITIYKIYRAMGVCTAYTL